jgi:hypothetical protein
MAAGKVHHSTFTYPPPPQQGGKVLHERRNTPHSSKDFLYWKKSDGLTKRQSAEVDLDITERFYHDYLHDRTTGDVGMDVITKAQTEKPSFDPSHYIAGALQNTAHDPGRYVPQGLDLRGIARVKSAQYDRAMSRTQTRQVIAQSRQGSSQRSRRWSSGDLASPVAHTNVFEEDERLTRMERQRQSQMMQPQSQMMQPQSQMMQPQPPPQHVQVDVQPSRRRPRSALAKELDTSINPEIIPAVEDWLQSANPKEREVASRMLRAISRQGEREQPPAERPPSRPSSGRSKDPASVAAKRSTSKDRVNSAGLSRNRKEVNEVHDMFEKMAKQPNPKKYLPKIDPKQQSGSTQKKLRRSSSDTSAKGSMFTTSQHQMPSHFTIAPDWPSEATNKY